MSKYLIAFTAFLFISTISIIPTSIALAQDDYDGIEVPDAGVDTTTEPEVENETFGQFVERLSTIKNDEQTKFQLAKERRLAIITANQANLAAGEAAQDLTVDYRLASILVSARFHKTIELYANYLLLVEQSVTPTTAGVGSKAMETQLIALEQDILDVSTRINEMDFTLDNVTGTSQTDLSNLTADISSQSDTIKKQLEGIHFDMLDLVESIQ